jgi:pyrroline-5-carboxylate reductase
MKLAFIGAGKMAAALARGVIEAGLCGRGDIRATARTAASREAFAASVSISLAAMDDDNRAAAAGADAVFLCVKPAATVEVLGELAPALGEATLVVSIAAGVSLADLQAAAGPGKPVIRAMPNTPALVRRGATAYALGESANASHAALAAQVFSALGDAHQVDEKLINAVNGLSGSGPAYVFLVIEALADGGVLMGLPRPLAASLAAQTVLGAAEMVRQTGRHPADLREAVASPGGTTIAALESLEQSGLRAALMGAVRAATEKAEVMGRKG